MRIAETKFNYFPMKCPFLKFYDFPMYGIFLGQITGFPGEWELRLMSLWIQPVKISTEQNVTEMETQGR